jgi:hypothetical protein
MLVLNGLIPLEKGVVSISVVIKKTQDSLEKNLIN